MHPRALMLPLLALTACRAPAPAPAPSEAPATATLPAETDAHGSPVEPLAPAPILTLEDLEYAAGEGFVGRIDLDAGVLFADIYDDEREEQKPIQATRLCGELLRERSEQWAASVRGLLGPEGALHERPEDATCEAERCWHEAPFAGTKRGLYRFEQGILREVAWTSGPPAHIMSDYLDAEDRFVAEAFEALRNAPCGAVYEGAIVVE